MQQRLRPKKNSFVKQITDEASRMEEKLAQLKQNLNQVKMDRSQVSDTSSSRWERQSQKSAKSVLREQKENEVDQFLKSIKMENYVTKFKENGFEELDILLDLEQDQLQQMQIPLGHQMRIMKKIQEFKDSKYEVLQGIIVFHVEPEIDESFTAKPKSTKMKPKQGPKKKVQFVESESEPSQANKSFLFFQLQEISEYMHKHDMFEDQQKEDQDKPNDFQQNTDEQGIQTQEAVSGNQPEQVIQSQLWIKKVACWNCYKLLEKGYLIESGKEYCSLECVNKYESQFDSECHKCKIKIDMRSCLQLNSCYFCSEECSKEVDMEILKDSYDVMEEQFKYDLNLDDIALLY